MEVFGWRAKGGERGGRENFLWVGDVEGKECLGVEGEVKVEVEGEGGKEGR